MMDIRKIKKLIELLEDSGLTELEIHEGEESVRLSRSSQGVQMTAAMPQAIMPMASPAPAQPATTTESASSQPATEELDGIVIRSPMVGTFYAAPSPEDDPYVQPGDSIKPGDVLCIIEAMKMFNQIDAEISGTIARILVENGQPVEFDQPLFLVKSS